MCELSRILDIKTVPSGFCYFIIRLQVYIKGMRYKLSGSVRNRGSFFRLSLLPFLFLHICLTLSIEERPAFSALEYMWCPFSPLGPTLSKHSQQRLLETLSYSSQNRSLIGPPWFDIYHPISNRLGGALMGAVCLIWFSKNGIGQGLGGGDAQHGRQKLGPKTPTHPFRK